MKKFIKINLIILVIFCLSCNFILIENYATTVDDNEENIEQPEMLMDDIIESLEMIDLNDIEEENNQSQAEEGQDMEDSDLENKKEEQTEMDELQIEKSELESEIENSNNQIQFIEEQLSINVVEIAEIDQKIYDMQMEVETLEAQEKQVLNYIEIAEKELEKSNERYNSRKELLETRLVAMYEMGQLSYLELLLSSKNVTEFMANYFLIEEITNSDAELLDSVEDELKYNTNLKNALDNKKKALSESREKREKNAISLNNMAIIKTSKTKQLTKEELKLQQTIEEYQRQVAEIETEIRLLAIANISSEYIGGAMAWPVPGYTRITSQFGMRTHPITGVYKLHTGVDIGAPMGANFIAANDGIVTYAGWNNAYGNMVIIDHGGGITTLYAHGSEILVQVGDTVMQGNPILKVGSTGYSTGPHAHFEVRINGEYVEPLEFITSYSMNINVQNNLQTNMAEENSNTINENILESEIVNDFENIEDSEKNASREEILVELESDSETEEN